MYWNMEIELGSFARSALNANLALMSPDDFRRNEETNAKSLKVDGRFFNAIELLENVFLLFLADTNTEIPHTYVNAVATILNIDLHFRCSWRILNGIGQKVDDNLLYAQFIPKDFPREAALFNDIKLWVRLINDFQHVIQHGIHYEGFHVELHLADRNSCHYRACCSNLCERCRVATNSQCLFALIYPIIKRVIERA